MAHYILTAPVTFTDKGSEKTTYRRVGVVFENTRLETGDTILSIQLDFPIGVTELVAFPQKSGDDLD